MTYLNNLQVILALFIPLFLGIFLYRKKLVDSDFPKGLSNYLFYIALPCTIISSMQFDIGFAEFASSLPLILTGVAITFACWGLAKLTAPLVEKDRKKRRLIEYSFMFCNFAYTGYPILENLDGKESLFYASIFNIGLFVLTVTVGTYVIKRAGADEAVSHVSWKDVLSPPFLSLFVGIALLLLPIRMPMFLDQSIHVIAATTTPMALLMTGMIIARERAFDWKNWKVFFICLFRLLLIPIGLLLLLKAFGCSGPSLYVPVILMANPVAVNIVLFAETYGAPSDEAANIVVWSSVLSIFTIPLVNLLI